MKELWALLGRLLYKVLWPLIGVGMRLRKRVRIVISHKRDVLVVKTWLSEDKWSLPGGGMHFKEDPKTAASREIYEELGIRIAPASLNDLYDEIKLSSNKGIKYKYYCFEVTVPNKLALKPNKIEVMETAWINTRDVLKMELDKTAKHALAEWIDKNSLIE